MPWSEWIEGPPAYVKAWGRFFTLSNYASGDDASKLDDTDPTTLQLTAINFSDDPPERSHIQFLPAPANADPMFPLVETPPGFSTIAGDWNEGWVERPNYVPGDPSTRVEYEPGHVATLGGWEWFGRPRVSTRSGVTPMPATIEYITPSGYFDGAGTAEYDLTDHPTYPLPRGDVVLNVPGDAYGGTFLSADPLPPLGPDVPGFAVTIYGEETNDTEFQFVQVNLGNLYTLVQYPRWRYWIPGGVPLRLMQRGDGLGMGSGRVYGTGTRQASTRVFGAL